jgi:hypothetical protein
MLSAVSTAVVTDVEVGRRATTLAREWKPRGGMEYV